MATPGDIVSFSVQVGGNAIPETISTSIISITVEKRTNRIPTAKIVIADGDPAAENFSVSSSNTFAPGSAITIQAGYDTVTAVIFTGIITGQSLTASAVTGSFLEVECRDQAVKMTVGRKCLTFSNQKDSDIISSIIGNYALQASVTATTTTWPEQVQYYATDWDFMLCRAEANGMVVNAVNGKISVGAPNAAPSPVATITYGDNLLEFDACLDAVSQLGSVQASSWDYTKQAVVQGQASNNVAGPGNLSSETLSQVAGPPTYQLQTSAYLSAEDLTNWSQAQLIKSEFSKIQGEVKFYGTSAIDPGMYITLAGLGGRFNGDHYVSGVVHQIAVGNWTTETSVGLSNTWFSQQPDVVAPSASGLLPGVRGLFNGTVKQMSGDPDSQYRILVDVPLFDQNGTGIWARLSNFYSTSGAGAYFLPEVGDEVVIGFLNEDPRFPLILGSLYSSTNKKPFNGLDPEDKNTYKAIVSKSGIFIKFNDVDKVLTISTPGNNIIELSDKEKQISITDENNNSIVMSSSGIAIKSCKDITLSASAKISLDGPTGITVTSSGGDVKTSGVNIKETAQMQFAAQGSMTASVKGGTELTLKAAMVMIN